MRTGCGLLAALLLAALFVPARAANEPVPTPAAEPGHPSAEKQDRKHDRKRRGPKPLVVSLTFDDGYANQAYAAEAMTRAGMSGTFFINSGLVGKKRYLNWAQLEQIGRDGHELGGHGLSHAALPFAPSDEQSRQVCDDRIALSRKLGREVTSFAYPYGAQHERTRKVIRECGYTSARGVGGLWGSACTDCALAERRRPEMTYQIRALSSVVTDTKVSAIQAQIRRATRTGGWAPLVFHDVCEKCSDQAISEADFDELLTWLGRLRDSGQIEIRTVQDMIDRPARPLVEGAPASTATARVRNADLRRVFRVNLNVEGLSNGPQPTCWSRSAYGENRTRWAVEHDEEIGGNVSVVTLDKHRSGDAKLVVSKDTGGCSPAIEPGRYYDVSALYQSSGPARFVAFYLDKDGEWHSLGTGKNLAETATWKRGSWVTPPAPEDAVRISFGIALHGDGSLRTTRYAMRATGDPRLPQAATVGGGFALTLLVLLAAMFASRQRRLGRARRAGLLSG